MIRHCSTLYAGHIDVGDMGQLATPANERRYSNERLASVFDKAEALARACDDLGYFFHLAETREKAIREITPFYEEHVKMFAPLGFVPGLTPDQVRATAKRGGWAAAGTPRSRTSQGPAPGSAGRPRNSSPTSRISRPAIPGSNTST